MPFDLDIVLDLAAALCLLAGGVLALSAGVGLLRFPDALTRLHAGTKPQIFGLVLVVIAIALGSRTWFALLVLAPVIVFQLLTAPVAAHMIGRAGYRTKNHRRDLLAVDELESAVERASRESAAEETGRAAVDAPE